LAYDVTVYLTHHTKNYNPPLYILAFPDPSLYPEANSHKLFIKFLTRPPENAGEQLKYEENFLGYKAEAIQIRGILINFCVIRVL
jgi:hypothetical protein